MKSVWIVGASSGIGEALAIEYYKLGYCVFISARSEQALLTLSVANNGVALVGLRAGQNEVTLVSGSLNPQGIMIALPMDVTDEWSIAKAASQIQSVTKTVNKVIVNAGTCEYIDDTHIDLNLMRRVIETNLFGAVHVSNYAQPLLNHDDQPQIAFVSSSVTYQALPRAHAYGGSKAALRYFVECLKMDAQHQGIDVRVISPGFVKTPLTDKNDFDMPFMISSENAAKRIVKGLNSTRFDIHFPKRFTLLLKLFSLLPNSIKFNLLGKISKPESHDAGEVKS